MADQQALHAFAQWVAGCSGNEMQEARTFLEKLLRAWGWEDSSEAGMLFEQSIPQAGEGGNAGRADALIPGKVLIEMKSRKTYLGDHAGQLRRYWNNTTPKPAYAVLCNFDEFWIYDYNESIFDPVDAVRTESIAERWNALTFLGKKQEKPRFKNNLVEVTERQAHAMGELFYDLKNQSRKTDAFTELQAQRFVLQCVLCMFAEDRDMLPDQQFSRALEVCKEKKESTYDILSSLFTEMNTPGITPGGRFQGTPYFNGGLFSEIPRIELSDTQLDLLIGSAQENWKSVRPSIFGNIFEASSDPIRRHAMGQHFTSEADIMKVIQPTIADPWEKRIESAWKERDVNKLELVRFALQEFRVLDPACGSGNFLYMAYNSVKDLEAELLRHIQEIRPLERLKRKREVEGQVGFGFVTTNQFFGMDTDPFAVELARVTLMIARKVAHDRLGLTEQELPLDNLDKNIIEADALFTPWPKADAIVGNPPFLGTHYMRRDLGDSYVDRIYKEYPNMKDVDFCTHWFRKANDCIGEDGRAGLVATNSVREGKSRKASLDYIVDNGGFISNAVSSQRWSGDAKVFVSIVNWGKLAPHSCVLDGRVVPRINSSLRPGVDVSKCAKLLSNKHFSFVGVQPNGKGFVIDGEKADEWVREDPKSKQVVRPFSMGGNLTDNPLGAPDRWIVDFSNCRLEEAEQFEKPFRHVLSTVRPERLETETVEVSPGIFKEQFIQREGVLREKWWLFKRSNARLRARLEANSLYLGVPRVSKWVIFLECSKEWLPGDLVVAVTTDDKYIQGILTSRVHRLWVECQKSTLKGDTRYTHTTCFETFPFPQHVTPEQAEAIRSQMIELNDYRNCWMVENQKGITEMYNRYFVEPTSQLRKLHNSLDRLVLNAYGWGLKEDILINLLDLNQELASKEKDGLAVIGPWDPKRMNHAMT